MVNGGARIGARVAARGRKLPAMHRHRGPPMSHFQVEALDPAPFQHLFGRDDAELAALGAHASLAEHSPGYPCRVSLRDAAIGERVILLNFEHLTGATPYRSSHAIFVRDGAVRATPAAGEIPEYLERRLLSVRAFDAARRMTAAEVIEGRDARALFARLLEPAAVEFLHVHNARQGCYLARVDRA